MLLAERAGRKLERWSNSAPRGMAVITGNRRNRIRPIGLLHSLSCAAVVHKITVADKKTDNNPFETQDQHEPTGFV